MCSWIHAWTRTTASSSLSASPTIRAARSRSRCGSSARELQVPGERWRVRVRPGQQPQERCRHDRHLRHDRIHHPLVQKEGRADRAVPVHLQTTAREVDLLRARGSEQDVRLRLRHVERLHDFVGERRRERGLARRVPGFEGLRIGVEAECGRAGIGGGPERAIVGVESLRTPELGLVRPDPEHDLVRQRASRPEVHRGAEPRIPEGGEVHDAVSAGARESRVGHGVGRGRGRRSVTQRERRRPHEGRGEPRHREEDRAPQAQGGDPRDGRRTDAREARPRGLGRRPDRERGGVPVWAGRGRQPEPGGGQRRPETQDHHERGGERQGPGGRDQRRGRRHRER